jgi:hypothetical protein
MKKKNKNYVRPNRCPYCTYYCDSAADPYEKDRPKMGDLSFCLMCCEPSQFDQNMKLIKYDLNLIPDLLERNRIKLMGVKMHEWWERHADKDRIAKRDKYLKIMDRK